MKRAKVVGPAGLEPATFPRKRRVAAPTGFSTAPEVLHPFFAVRKPVFAFWSP